MKRSRFSEEQIIAILREQEAGAKTIEVCSKHGICDATFYKWKAKYGGMEVSDARRLKVIEEENSKLKKLLADAMLDNAMLRMWPQENGDAAARREAAAHLHQVYRMSQRRACQAIGADRSSVRYRCRRPDDGPLRSCLREIGSRPSSWWRFETEAEAPRKRWAWVESRLRSVHSKGSRSTAWRIVLRPQRRYQALRLWRTAARLRGLTAALWSSVGHPCRSTAQQIA